MTLKVGSKEMSCSEINILGFIGAVERFDVLITLLFEESKVEGDIVWCGIAVVLAVSQCFGH
jgi:hypothetical protein